MQYVRTKSPVAVDRLEQEIQQSAITIALDNISTFGEQLTCVFKATLSFEETVILEDIIAAHTGEPLAPAPSTVRLDGIEITNSAEKALKTVPTKLEGSSTFLVSHDFCDRTTWWSESVRVTNETLGYYDGITFASAHSFWIDLEHGKVPFEDRFCLPYLPIVKVNGVEVTAGFTIDYASGTVTFAEPQTGIITASYSYENGSGWTVRPLPGKILKMLGTEIRVATDCRIENGQEIVFEIFSGTIPLIAPVRYKNIRDILKCAMGNFELIPALGDSDSPVLVIPFEYITSKDLKSCYDMNVRISLAKHEPLPGSWAAVSAAALSIDE